MNNRKPVSIITVLIAVLSSVAASLGLLSSGGPGESTFTSVRGQQVRLYGHGIYHQMSAEVAPQGIAQDAVTLFIAVPLLLIGLVLYRKGSLRGKILLSGTLGYFLVTYLFFTLMAMYNQLFLLWVALLSLSFYGFFMVTAQLGDQDFAVARSSKLPTRAIGMFLMCSAILIALLWLSIVLPSALSGTIPAETEHYTTLVVQALDLAILLPASFISGLFLYRNEPAGYRYASVYVIFLSILMTALSAKIAAMGFLGYSIIPAVFIIPAFNLAAILSAALIIKYISENSHQSSQSTPIK